MSDIFSVKKRSQIMAKISGSDTAPEIFVRSRLHSLGFRFRKNVKTLPGRPDIVLSQYATIIQIHGCFWHGHKGCQKSKLPKSNVDFWRNKISRNQERDSSVDKALNCLGWKVITVWECELRNEIRRENLITVLSKILKKT
jgi:DNA mismatch endonuclease, patch repair protein